MCFCSQEPLVKMLADTAIMATASVAYMAMSTGLILINNNIMRKDVSVTPWHIGVLEWVSVQ